MGQLLRRLGISYRRGRDYVHSPDPDYPAKLAAIAAARTATQAAPARPVLLYLDEVTVYRQPTLAGAWAVHGTDQPRAGRSHASNTPTRRLGALDADTGALHSLRAAKLTIPRLVAGWQHLRAAYPEAERLWVVLDNWPLHFHPDVLVALEPQQTPFPLPQPGHWPTVPSELAQRRWGDLALPIQLLPLPTSASWCTPIEKVWRTLRQELGHLHPWADDLDQLRAALDRWRVAQQQPSPELLRYVGLAMAE